TPREARTTWHWQRKSLIRINSALGCWEVKGVKGVKGVKDVCIDPKNIPNGKTIVFNSIKLLELLELHK
ncbi:MAG: hypothetical protein ACI3ZD_07045, partial [Prevotella sp.]